MVTGQLQVKRRTGKVCRPRTNVLPLCHTTNFGRKGGDSEEKVWVVCMHLPTMADPRFKKKKDGTGSKTGRLERRLWKAVVLGGVPVAEVQLCLTDN